jgi:hypothetical protein
MTHLDFFEFLVGIQTIFAFFLLCKLLDPELIVASGFEPPTRLTLPQPTARYPRRRVMQTV